MFRTGFVGRQFPSGLGAGTITGAAPSLNLDFTGGALDSRITFARASTATYFDNTGTMQTAGNNVARFDYDPASRQMRGLLIEESRTNVIFPSSAINSWGKADTTITDNSTTSPDGTTNASLCVEGVAGTALVVSATGTVTSGATVTGTGFVKRGNTDWLRFIVGGDSVSLTNGAQVWVNTNTGAIGTVSVRGSATAPSASIQAINNGWYRVTIICTLPAGTTTAAIGACSAPADNNTGRVNSAQYYLWGGQCEQAAFPTSYIPTTAAAVTRAFDVANMPTANSWYNQGVGSLSTECMWEGINPAAGFPRIAQLDDGTNNNNITHLVGNTIGRVYVAATSGGSAAWNYGPNSSWVAYLLTRQASAWQSGYQGYSLNGSNLSTGSSVIVPVGLTALRFGADASNNPSNHGIWIRRVKYWPRALASSDLVVETGAPSLDIDLRAPTLDPRITFTRASNGSYFDSNGILQSASNNVARLDYDPITLQPRGLLIEEARTNSIRNGNATGAVVGGSFPTNWAPASPLPGTSMSVVGVGTEHGMGYADIRIQGNGGPNLGNQYIAFEGNVTATDPQTWTFSLYFRVVGGSLANVSFALLAAFANGGTNGFLSNIIPATSGDTLQTRYQCTGTTVPATTSLRPYLQVSSRNDIDVTVRCMMPQLEIGAFPTSYIPTSGATATRATDIPTILLGPWYTLSSGTIGADYSTMNFGGRPIQIDDGTASNLDIIFMSVNAASGNSFSGGANDGRIDTTAPFVAGSVIRAAYSYSPSQRAISAQGAAAVTSASAARPISTTTMRLGRDQTVGANIINGYMRRVRFWPRALSNTELAQVTS